jgi:hypothetical protein
MNQRTSFQLGKHCGQRALRIEDDQGIARDRIGADHAQRLHFRWQGFERPLHVVAAVQARHLDSQPPRSGDPQHAHPGPAGRPGTHDRIDRIEILFHRVHFHTNVLAVITNAGRRKRVVRLAERAGQTGASIAGKVKGGSLHFRDSPGTAPSRAETVFAQAAGPKHNAVPQGYPTRIAP